jgi:hypothetical protein
MIGQAFGEESMSRTWMFGWKTPNSLRPKVERREKQSQEHVHHYL